MQQLGTVSCHTNHCIWKQHLGAASWLEAVTIMRESLDIAQKGGHALGSSVLHALSYLPSWHELTDFLSK